MITCQCPAAAALETIPNVTCPENFGQIQKIAFQRILDDKGDKNVFDAMGEPPMDIKIRANWVNKMVAEDSTKIVVSPFVEAPTAEPGEPITFGGGNETLGGIEMIIGSNPTPFTAVMRRVPQSVIKSMKSLMCESQTGNLGVYLFDGNGNIGCLRFNGTSDFNDDYNEDFGGEVFAPIPIRALFISDKGFGGLETPDSNTIQFSFPPNYSDNFVIVTPKDFNPIDLKI